MSCCGWPWPVSWIPPPTRREAEALVGHEVQTDEDFQYGLHQIAGMGAHNVLITLRTGCYALLRTGRNRERMFRAWIERQEAVSAVGSGDALRPATCRAGRPSAPMRKNK